MSRRSAFALVIVVYAAVYPSDIARAIVMPDTIDVIDDIHTIGLFTKCQSYQTVDAQHLVLSRLPDYAVAVAVDASEMPSDNPVLAMRVVCIAHGTVLADVNVRDDIFVNHE